MSAAISNKIVLDKRLHEERDYWLKQLAGATELSPALTALPQPANGASEKGEALVSLAGEAYRKLRMMTGGSPFLVYTFLMAALDVCLHKSTGGYLVVVGSPALKSLGGANALPILARVSREQTFRQLLMAVRETLLEAYKRQAYPIVRLIEDLGRDSATGEWPLFDVVLGHRGLHGPLPDLRSDVTMMFEAGTDSLLGRIAFAGGAAERRRAQGLGTQLLNLVAAAVDGVDKRVADLSTLSGGEIDEIVHGWNETAASYPISPVHRLFEAQAASTPDSVALAADGTTLTYRVLNERANRLARRLREKGVAADIMVGVAMDGSPQMLVGLLGALKAGGACLPIDPAWPPARTLLILKESGTRIVLTSAVSSLPDVCGCERLDADASSIETEDARDLDFAADPQDAAVVQYVSGWTGRPLGVVVPHRALVNRLWWARKRYLRGRALDVAVVSPVASDSALSALLLPLIAGGTLVISGARGKAEASPFPSVLAEDRVDVVTLVPAQLALEGEPATRPRRLRTLVVNGEALRSAAAKSAMRALGRDVEIHTEFGSIEAASACTTQQFHPIEDMDETVPIGSPVDNVRVYLLDKWLSPVPVGVLGEIYVAGEGLARGYLARPDLTAERFLPDPFVAGTRMYRTGALGRWRAARKLEFCDRADGQAMIAGERAAFAEVAAALSEHPQIRRCVVDVVAHSGTHDRTAAADANCARCGLPADFPGATFDAAGVCDTCREFDSYREKALRYFRPVEELKTLFESRRAGRCGTYDCLLLYSGGGHSTYALCRLAAMGLKVLAFTLDNGYLSEDAKQKIDRVTRELGVDHIFATTPFMRDVFSESLQIGRNVCGGCLKTVDRLGVQVARERGIDCIVTGLSRGHLVEVRLAELFAMGIFDPDEIARHTLAARRAYHHADDALARSLSVAGGDGEALKRIEVVDFYRYCAASLDEIQEFLRRELPYLRADDAARATRCLISQAGAEVHKKSRGFHVDAVRYCWDVRLGSRTREAAIRALADEIDIDAANGILIEIGRECDAPEGEKVESRLIGYYVADRRLSAAELRAHLAQRLPRHMIPAYFVRLDEMPLLPDGAVDRKALPRPKARSPAAVGGFAPPGNPIEAGLAEIWTSLLHVGQVGIHDNFFDLGGHSLLAARVMVHVRGAFGVELPVRRLFEAPTIAALAEIIASEKTASADADEPALVALSRDVHRRHRSSVVAATGRPAE